jgi:AcrR family transcriptional regulator
MNKPGIRVSRGYDRPVVSPAHPVPAPTREADGTTSDRLLDAAAEVFCERGYDGTTVAEVARRAGLTTGAIYANFRDKAELLLKTIERGSTEVVADMETARDAGVSAADRLLLMARRMVSEPDSTERLLFVEMFSAARRHPDVGRRVTEALSAMEGELARLMERARDDGDLDPVWEAAVLARFCLALGVGFTQLAVAGLPDPDATQWVALAGRIISAVRPPAVAPPAVAPPAVAPPA